MGSSLAARSHAILVHGGAGSIADEEGPAHMTGTSRAAEVGRAILAAGGSAVDAVCSAVQVLEDDPVFNAGIGSTLDADGMITCDAAIMRGQDLAYGAVGSVAGVLHPVDLARRVLEDGKYSFLVGPGAIQFARRSGVRLVSPAALETAPSKAKWWSASATPSVGDTVGAVARDSHGNLAAATSTGGLLGKYPGRVGDSPLPGCGTYARNGLGAASATGHGETLMKVVAAYAALQIQNGAPDEAAYSVLDHGLRAVGGRGGLILALPDGRVAWARNTLHMGFAYALDDAPVITGF